MYENISKGSFKMDTSFSEILKDLLRHLIQVDITKRYGNLKNGVDDIKQHEWFKDLDWWTLYNKKLSLPSEYIPETKNLDLASNFDDYREEEILQSSKVLFEKEFKDF